MASKTRCSHPLQRPTRASTGKNRAPIFFSASSSMGADVVKRCEVAETVREIGLTPWSAQGTAERQAWVADLSDQGLFGSKGTKEFARSPDWRTEADRIL